ARDAALAPMSLFVRLSASLGVTRLASLGVAFVALLGACSRPTEPSRPAAGDVSASANEAPVLSSSAARPATPGSASAAPDLAPNADARARPAATKFVVPSEQRFDPPGAGPRPLLV